MIGAAPAPVEGEGAAPAEGGAPAEAAVAPEDPSGEVLKAVNEIKDLLTDLKDDLAEMKANADLVGQVTQLNGLLGRAFGDGVS
jgi:hypothetical protein